MSISTNEKSIIPLFSLLSRCYNVHTSRVEPQVPLASFIHKTFTIYRNNCYMEVPNMKKNTISQNICKAMESYGKMIILAERF